MRKRGETFEIIRTRDEEAISNADYVFDVGGIYDEDKNRFDHHQKDGAGKRENGIEYASFGLVWRKFGIKLCVDTKVVDLVDKILVAPIDAETMVLIWWKINMKFHHILFIAFFCNGADVARNEFR